MKPRFSKKRGFFISIEFYRLSENIQAKAWTPRLLAGQTPKHLLGTVWVTD